MKPFIFFLALCLLFSCSKDDSSENNNQNNDLSGTWMLTSIIDEGNGQELVVDSCRTRNKVIFNAFNSKFESEYYKITCGVCKLEGESSGTFVREDNMLTTTINGKEYTSTILSVTDVFLKFIGTDNHGTYTSTYKKK